MPLPFTKDGACPSQAMRPASLVRRRPGLSRSKPFLTKHLTASKESPTVQAAALSSLFQITLPHRSANKRLMDSYPYKQLDASKREIRLLVLNPGSQELRGRLIHASLEAKPSFEALSYTWGQPPFHQSILIDNYIFHIGPNLEVALRKLREPDVSRTLWIDAICINQNDELERRQQIQEMQHIFASAVQVRAWLGEDCKHGELAISLLERLQEGHLAKFRADNFSSTEWLALKNFWSQPYFKRIWIVQEIAVAHERALIGYGSRWIQRSAFENALNILIAHRNNHETLLWEGIDSDMDWFLNLSQICRCDIHPHANRNLQDLESLLYVTEHFEATVNHDHFFALLGLSREEDRLAIPIDYSGCFADLCSKVLLHIIVRTGSLNVLSGNRSKRNDKLSSWMPSFSDPVRRGYGWNTFRKFHAAGRSPARVKLSLCRRLLTCDGIAIGNIGNVEGPFENSESAFLNGRALLNMRRIATDTSWYDSPSKSSQQLDIAFWETLFANRSMGGDVKSSPEQSLKRLDYLTNLLDQENSDTEAGLISIEDELKRSLMPHICNLVSTLRFRCFFTTSDGFMGVGPYNIRRGDLAVILFGADVPFILREDGDGYSLIGDAFVYGVMNGELREEKGRNRQHFKLK